MKECGNAANSSLDPKELTTNKERFPMTTSDTKISVVIPCYNVEKYLVRAVESVQAQTFAEWEAILVDDGSTDKTPELCDSLTAKDARIKVIHTQNGGGSRARNEGLRNATGTLVYFMDADDWIEPQCFAKCWDAYTQSQADIIQFGFCIWRDGVKSQVPLEERIVEGEDVRQEYAAQIVGYGEKALRHYYEHGNLGNYKKDGYVWRFMFSRQMLSAHSIVFPEGVKMGEDGMFVVEATIFANRVHCIEDTFYNYELKDGGAFLSRINNPEKMFDDKYALLPLRARLRSMVDTFDLHDCYFVSQVFSALQLCLALSCSLYNYPKLATYVYDKRVTESFEKIQLNGAPLKFKIPVSLIKHKLTSVLFLLCWTARKCGLAAKLKM